MNFFEEQERARRRTVELVLLFVLAVTGMILLVNLLVLVTIVGFEAGMVDFNPTTLARYFRWDIAALVSVAVLVLITLGSLHKTLALGGDGGRVAELLGGRLVGANTKNEAERRLLNVVEEMAIAAGIPVPRVYLLDEPGINAFAAGTSPADAVIGVTRGALMMLNRDELQGVVAHEFSHIFNGDMRLNLRLVGVLHGILLLGMVGYHLLRLTTIRGSRRSGGGRQTAALAALGVGLLAVGSVGYCCGQLIKAMVSRQREYLADASAVQFTRQQKGIGGALKKIGGAAAGSRLETPAASEYSHAYLAAGVTGFLQGLFATHPPLPERIRKIDPGWDGQFITPGEKKPLAGDKLRQEEDKRRISPQSIEAAGVLMTAGVLNAGRILERIGTVDEQGVEAARVMLGCIPGPLRTAASEPFGVRAVIYGLLLDHRPEIRAEQWRLLTELADPTVVAEGRSLEADLSDLPEEARLPLLELALPTLRNLSLEQYQRFRRVVEALIEADQQVSLREWIVRRLVVHQLDLDFSLRKPPRPRYREPASIREELALLLSLIAHAEHPDDPEKAIRAFVAGEDAFGETGLRLLPRTSLNTVALDAAMDTLEMAVPLLKQRLLQAFTACLMFDGRSKMVSWELLRTIAACLDVPVPLHHAAKEIPA
ncbi:M48 family metallopeptidase [Desulfobulbus alkaliphilus]|uniref:M48 family metallopeptidase n=1 Tax=Desulfobulbus alkaliphilus TaxID=869814 RepID=UPI001965B4FD|nr:M48 family metallopeptidase [Desulfobulbus alkaliphilus]MBM9536475.1 M48 family metallopeptidase [Desulfobulbus alkaliphilus]